MCILIADDSIVVRNILLQTLHLGGFQNVKECSDGLAALQTFRVSANRFQLCVFDVNMPGMDGIALTREIRKLDCFVPIMILTTESSREKMEQARRNGANGWIIKPFSSQQFVALIHTMVH